MRLAQTFVPMLLLAAAVAAQPPAPPPVPERPVPALAPLPPVPQERPVPAVAPEPPLPPEPPRPFAVAPIPPLPPVPPDLADQMSDLDGQLMDLQDRLGPLQDYTADVREYAKDAARLWARDLAGRAPRMALDLALGNLRDSIAMAPQRLARVRQMTDDGLYNAGQRALDDRRFAEALEDFTQVASRGGTRADAALYWKAYTLIKLGRRDEARAAVAELRKSYPSSRWLDDAKVLEVDAGKPVSPESESDEQLKLIALNGLMQSDPDRALPLLDNLLKGNQPPSLKKRVIYVLAASNSPKAQQLLQQVARGGQGNPDLQLVAIRYLGERRNQPANTQLLSEIYNSSADPNIKRAVLTAFGSSRDRDRLLQIAKAEKDQDLRLYAIRMLGSINGAQADLWQLYQTEPSTEGKRQILESMPSTGNLDRLLEIAKTEKDPKLRRFAIEMLSSQRAASTGDSLAALYASEQDPDVKRAILDALYSQKNVKALVQTARAEKDPRMKQQIVERVARIHSPEATDYLMEILK